MFKMSHQDSRSISSYSSGDMSNFDFTARVQKYGVLWKKPFGHSSSKWSRRFFIVKDGFLLYYPESEKKEFERRRAFNIHPKGCIPLGNVVVDTVEDGNQEYAIHIKFECGNFLALAADTNISRNKWVEVLRQSSRVTWLNTQLSENMIEELELQGLQFCKEKEDYHNRLQSETIALRDEMSRNEELLTIATELEKEKEKMEEATVELQEECDRIKRELDLANEQLSTLEKESTSMKDLTADLELQLQSLKHEKDRVLRDLSLKEHETQKLSKENHNLSQATSELRVNLESIENKIKQVSETKEATVDRLRHNEEMAQILQEEKVSYRQQAQELMVSLNDLMAQKHMTELELKEEIEARLQAERRLKEAEESLSHLEGALRKTRESLTVETKNTMMTDVKTLKRFFEEVAIEAQIDANKPIIMKNAVYARKNFVRRAKTLKAQTLKKYKTRNLENKPDKERLAATLNLDI